MNFLYISASNIPSKTANSIHVMKMAEALAKKSVKVTLFARANGSASNESDFNYYGTENLYALEKVKVPGKKYLNNIFYSLNLYKKVNEISRKDNKNNNRTIIYGRDLLAITFLSFFNKNIYYEAHSMPSNIVNKYLFKILIKSKNFKELIVISQALKTEIQYKYPNAKKINVLHDGANTYKELDFKIEDEEIIVGYSGSIYKGRGIENIIEVAKKLKEIKFMIVGGTKEQVLELLPKEIELPNNLIFLGYINPKEVPSKLKEMTILLAPYQKKVGIGKLGADTSKWMSPLKVFEYMAAEKAIICSDIPVLREVLRDQYNCLLVNPEKNEEWVSAIKYLIENAGFRKKIAHQAKLDLEKLYSWEVRAEKIIEIVENK